MTESALKKDNRLMWLGLLTLFAFMAGCSSPETPRVEVSEKRLADVRERIEKAVDDPARAAAMNEILAEMEGKLKAYEQSIDMKRQAIINANVDYATSREQLEELYSSMSTEVLEMMEYVQGVHFRLKDQAIAEEWKTISGGRKKLFELN